MVKIYNLHFNNMKKQSLWLFDILFKIAEWQQELNPALSFHPILSLH